MLNTLLRLSLLSCLFTSAFATIPPPTDQERALLKATSKAFAFVAQQAIPAVVSIKVEATLQPMAREYGNGARGQGDALDPFYDEFFRQFFGIPPESGVPVIGQGSGCLVSADGFILTNNHIVGTASRIEVELTDGRRFKADIIGTDPHSDLAVIKINERDLPYLKLGDSDALAVGEWVVAIGAPFGLEATVTVGVVSGKQRNQLGITDSDDFIQTDAAINPGNSGGPLLNLDAEVVGINTAILTRSGVSAGVGFAIPSNMARRVMDQLISNGRVTRGFLGFTLQNVDADMARAFGLSKARGALVTEVLPNSPAQSAGVEAGDIIVEFNGKPVDSITGLRNLIAMMAPGDQATLGINRGETFIERNVIIGQDPGASAGLLHDLGLELTPLTEALRKELDYGSDQRGVVISAVTAGSVAARARLTPGTVIVRVGRTPVTTPKEVEQALEELRSSGEPLPLLVRQGPHTRYVLLKAASEP